MVACKNQSVDHDIQRQAVTHPLHSLAAARGIVTQGLGLNCAAVVPNADSLNCVARFYSRGHVNLLPVRPSVSNCRVWTLQTQERLSSVIPRVWGIFVIS